MVLFINGVGVLEIENGIYYKTNEKWECLQKCNRNEFIEELKKYSWVCLTTWDKELRQQYLDLVDYVNNMDK